MGYNYSFYHDVGEISDLSQSEAPNSVMWRVRVMQPTTPSPWRRGRSWPQFNVQENGSMKWNHEISLEIYCRTRLTKINCKDKWDSVGKITFLIKLVFFIRNSCIYERMQLEFYLKSSTGKSYSNIRTTQRSFVNQGLTVANMWWTVLTYN